MTTIVKRSKEKRGKGRRLMAAPVEIFCCYAREDQLLLRQLKTHLMSLQWQGLITLWADTDINAGWEWEKEIEKHLNTAQLILLLISPDFMASEYCYSKEMKRAVERHERGEARVIPVILRPVTWQEAPFGKLQALPTDAKPVKSWLDPDAAFLDVAEGIREAVKELGRPSPSLPTEPVESPQPEPAPIALNQVTQMASTVNTSSSQMFITVGFFANVLLQIIALII